MRWIGAFPKHLNWVDRVCIGAAIAGLVIWAALVAIDWAMYAPRRTSGEVRSITPEEISVIHEFSDIQAIIDQFSADNRVPPSTLSKLLQEKPHPGLRLVNSGRDPWGNELVYEVSTFQQAEGISDFVVTLRSIGSNGIDESGKGDDIQRVMHGSAIPNRPRKR
jgi:hypothetical protein